jgi:uncharacterized membrane protein
MSREAVGAFVDAIYAIALTILALEVPSELDDSFAAQHFGLVLLEYAVAFAILFAFWIQHRRIVGFHERLDRGALWLNGLVLLLVCIIPRATMLVFEHGGDVTLAGMTGAALGGTALSEAQIVDLLYVIVVVAADALLLVLVRSSVRALPHHDAQARAAHASKAASSVVLYVIVALSLVLPLANRYFLLALPFALFLEREILRMLPDRFTQPAP